LGSDPKRELLFSKVILLILRSVGHSRKTMVFQAQDSLLTARRGKLSFPKNTLQSFELLHWTICIDNIFTAG